MTQDEEMAVRDTVGESMAQMMPKRLVHAFWHVANGNPGQLRAVARGFAAGTWEGVENTFCQMGFMSPANANDPEVM